MVDNDQATILCFSTEVTVGIMEGEFKRVSAQSLECSICLNVFNEPKILSCSHTFCLSCLKRLLESQLDITRLACPVCRNVTDVPDGDVSRVQTNIALMSLVDDVKSQQQNCTHCKTEESPEAVSYCQDCGKYFCVACHKKHSEWQDFATHVVHSMSDVRTGKVVVKTRRKCKKHQHEDEEYFCSECRRYVCFRCGVREHEQKGHETLESAEHEENLKKSIKELNSKADTKTEAINKYITFVREQRTLLNEAKKKLDSEIVEAYEEAVQHLTQRKELLRNLLEEKFRDYEKDLKKEEEVSGQHRIHINAVKELIGNGLKIPLEEDALAAHDTLCQDLQTVLDLEDPDFEKPKYLLKEGEKVSFERFTESTYFKLGRIWRVCGKAIIVLI